MSNPGYRGVENNPNAMAMLEYMEKFCLDYNYPPTVREIAEHLECSTSVVAYYGDQLVNAGLAIKIEKTSRGLMPTSVHMVRIE